MATTKNIDQICKKETIPSSGRPNETDNVLERRARISGWCQFGKRLGYLFLLVSTIAFVFALATSMSKIATTIAAMSLVASCVVLPPAIVFAYGVKSAAKQDL